MRRQLGLIRLQSALCPRTSVTMAQRAEFSRRIDDEIQMPASLLRSTIHLSCAFPPRRLVLLASCVRCYLLGLAWHGDAIAFCGRPPCRAGLGPAWWSSEHESSRDCEKVALQAVANDEDGTTSGGSTSSLLLPIGPFCPFRSSFSTSSLIDTEMAVISERAQSMSQRFAPIALEAQMGRTPDPEVVRPLAKDMRETSDLWKVVLGRMQLTQDFQGIEFYKLTEAQIERKGMTMQIVQGLMTWQMEGMMAFCEGRLPPPPPPGVSQEMLASIQDTGPAALSNMLSNTGQLTASPFDPTCSAMQSEVVRDEFQRLRNDHQQLVKMGETYGSFDAAGKEMFLDQMDEVESRWEIFMARFQLMGELNPQYVQEATAYLDKVNMSPKEFRALLKEAHQIMRRDVEKERLSR